MVKSSKSIVRRTPWPKGTSRSVVTPLLPSVVYGAESPDELDAIYDEGAEGYTYAREGHPNADVLAQKIDDLEGITGGIITGSGMSAVTAVLLSLLKAGDHIVGADQLYGRSLRLMKDDLPRLGIETSLVDPTAAANVAAAIRPNTKMVLIELVSNPTLRIADITGIARLTSEMGILLVVDNTFTTPRSFLPFEHGADIVIHSVTKLLAGHSDVTLGYLVARDAALQAQIKTTCVTFGLTPSPFDCWLAERGLYSFELRYDRAEENAAKLADALAGLPNVLRVLYPSRTDHPDHALARQLLGKRGGNMVSFEIEGGREAANLLVRAAENIAFAPTLGDIATTLSHPASSSHRALSEADRKTLGISEGFFRVSVGVENIELLIAEFTEAINAARC
ncbi:MAG: trans-sulfuration enzyme family protein [Paracoccaceae bacterium]